MWGKSAAVQWPFKKYGEGGKNGVGGGGSSRLYMGGKYQFGAIHETIFYLRVRLVRIFSRLGARFSEVCTQSVHVFLAVYHYCILGGCIDRFPGAQFWEKCTLCVLKIKS